MTTVYAPAKLTLSLRITGTRPDGFHLIDAEMVTLDLADRLDISDGAGIEVHGLFAAGVPTDSTNLVARALMRAGRQARIVINKQIPSQGGLGGGSADAAAILRWFGVTDLDLAVTIGADVPFCLVGGRARVTGVGEVVEPLEPVMGPITLCVPPFGVSTARCYQAWDHLGGPRSEGDNDLEPAAVFIEPRLGRWLDRFNEATGVVPTLAGSGSTMFVRGHHPAAVAALTDAVVLMVNTTGRPT